MSNSSTMTDEQKLTSFKWMGFYKHPYLKHCVVHINETLHDLKVAILNEFLQYHAEHSNKSWKKKRLLDGIRVHMLNFREYSILRLNKSCILWIFLATLVYETKELLNQTSLELV